MVGRRRAAVTKALTMVERPDGRVRRGDAPPRRDALAMLSVARDETHEFAVPGAPVIRWRGCSDDLDGPGWAAIDGNFQVGTSVIGCFAMREFRLPPDVDDDPVGLSRWIDDFRMSETQEVARALCHGWMPGDIRPHGSVVTFSRLWVAPSHAVGSRWALAINAFLDSRHGPGGPGGGALMLLKPFPLEYEGAFDPEANESMVALDARRAAMRRLYAHRLGVEQLHGTGWMWRALTAALPRPSSAWGPPGGNPAN